MASEQEERKDLDQRARKGEVVVPGGTGGKSLSAQERLREGRSKGGKSSGGGRGSRREQIEDEEEDRKRKEEEEAGLPGEELDEDFNPDAEGEEEAGDYEYDPSAEEQVLEVDPNNFGKIVAEAPEERATAPK